LHCLQLAQRRGEQAGQRDGVVAQPHRHGVLDVGLHGATEAFHDGVVGDDGAGRDLLGRPIRIDRERVERGADQGGERCGIELAGRVGVKRGAYLGESGYWW
jgi:hypothetical protein